jgi:hypothetical protein
MALTRRGRALSALIVAVVVVGAVVVGIVAFGSTKKTPSADGTPGGSPSSTPTTPAPPPICPLSGLRARPSVPNRPALAVKVENLPIARPQTGLSWADIVYEEPVEAGITRFIVVYQCNDASRIEPVRSGRLTDPDILVQFGHPVFAYAGAVPEVVAKVAIRGIIDVNFNRAIDAYHRDPNRPQPHNLYTSTRELYAAAHTHQPAPKAIFTYAIGAPAGAKKVSTIHVPFSGLSDVFWKWSASKKAWLRFHGDVPHTLSDGTQVSARNVIVQMVRVTLTDITDVNGVPSPYVVSVGSGKAFIFRNGRVISGKWVRSSLREVTKFEDARGNEIPLMPGNTWIELVPNTIKIHFS